MKLSGFPKSAPCPMEYSTIFKSHDYPYTLSTEIYSHS